MNVTASQSNATVNGGISADNATANVSLTNGGRVTGGIQLTNGATGRIAVDGSGSALSSSGTALSVAGGSNAELQISNGALLSSASGMAVDVTGNSQANMNVTNADVTGSLLRDAGSTLNVTLDGNTTFTGATNANTLNISNGALWTVGDATQSNVGTLDISNGRVDMNSGTGPFKTLKVGTLQGSGGTFTMGVDFIPGGGNDLLTISGNATGTHVLDPYGEDQGVKSPRNNIVVTQIGSGNASFSLSGNGRVDAGIYTYTLEHQGNEWVLVRDDSGGDTGGTGGGGPDAPPAAPPAPDTLSPAAVTALNTASALPFVWNNELGTLRQRQGDLRDNRAGDGLWVRPFSSFDRIDQMAAPGYDLDQYGMLIGADKRLPVKSGDLYVGGFGSYSYSQVDPRGGSSGRINSYGLGAYATWMGTDGWYVDSVVKANSFQSDLRVVGSNGRTSRGNYTTPGIGASVEVGKTIPLWDKGFMEPYGKLSAFAARGSSEKLDNNFDIDNGAQRSVQAEAGILAGHRFDLHDGRFIQPYIKMGLAHEFIDDNRSTLNGTRFTNDISGTRVIGGLGVSAQLKQNLQMHVDVDYSTGGAVDRAVTVNAGLRYVF
jgi:outer membrane autotransporter protein